MEKILDTTVGQYKEGLPLHLSDPERSALAVMSEAVFKKMEAGDVHELLHTKHLLIYGCSVEEPLNFDEQGMQTLCLPTHEFQVQGGSVFFVDPLLVIQTLFHYLYFIIQISRLDQANRRSAKERW